MMRLFVTVWKVTVATAWHPATTARTIRLVVRRLAMRQKPSEPTGIGFSQARRPKANAAERMARTARMIQ